MSLSNEWVTPTTPIASEPMPQSEQTRHVDGLDGPVELRRASGGYWQVWPRPTPEEQRALYGDDFYDKDKTNYLEKMVRDRAYWDATWTLRRNLIEAALPPGRRRILDVGSSGGFLLDHFQQHGWQGQGIEPSKSAAAWAREKYGIETFCGELLDFPAPETAAETAAEPASRLGSAMTARFDAVHSAQVLEHVLDPEACVERIASLLVPGGVAYIEVPNDFNAFQETARERLDKSSWWVAPRYHLNYFDYESLSALLARHGLIELDRLASFPIEIFLLMGDDYVGHPEVGAECHARRMRFEQSLIDSGRLGDLQKMYQGLAQASLGRTCGLLARKP